MYKKCIPINLYLDLKNAKLHLGTAENHITFNLVFIILWPVEVHGCCVAIQRVDRVGVGEQLREERLKDVGEV